VLTRALLDWRSRFERRRLEARARRLLHALVAVSAVATALAAYMWNPGFLHRLELDTVDTRFSVRGETAAPRDTALVAVDDATLRKFGTVDGRLPRRLQARLIDRVNAGRPRAIAEDITFEEPRAGDRALIAALKRASSRLVLATPFDFAIVEEKVRPGPMFGQDGFFSDTGIKPGWLGLPADPENVVRRIDYEITPAPEVDPDKTFRTLAAATAAVAEGDPNRLPSGARRRAGPGQSTQTTWIDYHGGPGTFRTVSARDVLSGRVPPDAFRDQVVVIGFVTSGPVDRHRTSVGDDPRMSGTEIHANAISTILRGAPLRDAPRIVDVLLIVALGLVPLLAWALPRWPAKLAVVLGAALAFLVSAQLLFAAGKIVAVIAPLFALGLATLGLLVVEALQAWTRHRGARPAT
jgi:adenylate cyclase